MGLCYVMVGRPRDVRLVQLWIIIRSVLGTQFVYVCVVVFVCSL